MQNLDSGRFPIGNTGNTDTVCKICAATFKHPEYADLEHVEPLARTDIVFNEIIHMYI